VRPVPGVCHLGQGGARFTRGNLITPGAGRSQGRVAVAGERCLPLKGFLFNGGKGLIDAKTGLKQGMGSSKERGLQGFWGLAKRERATIDELTRRGCSTEGIHCERLNAGFAARAAGQLWFSESLISTKKNCRRATSHGPVARPDDRAKALSADTCRSNSSNRRVG
jgi:hypothetical protein